MSRRRGTPAAPHLFDPPPVLLVPGFSDTARILRPCRQFLIRSGWPPELVAAPGFHRRFGSNLEHSAEIASAVDALAESAEGRPVAVVAHSMGGLALRHYLANGGGAAVSTAIFVGTPHLGTWLAWLIFGAAAREMRPGSAFLQRLAARPLPPHVRAHCIRTPIDTRVVPGSSALLEGAACHVVRFPTHPRMLRHRPTLRLIRRLLLEPPAAPGPGTVSG
jgi:triacylglycerol lipase